MKKLLEEDIESIIKQFESLYTESWKQWKESADMYEQGKADAYDFCEYLLRSCLETHKQDSKNH